MYMYICMCVYIYIYIYRCQLRRPDSAEHPERHAVGHAQIPPDRSSVYWE